MTKVKFCGLRRPEDIEYANELGPDHIGFVFAKKSKRYVTPDQAKELKAMLDPGIKACGVFVNEEIDEVVRLLEEGIIDIAQLHGSEDEAYINELKSKTSAAVIKAFEVRSEEDVFAAESSPADMVLLDSGKGSGMVFNWQLIAGGISRPYFLAGGLSCENAEEAVRTLSPYALDVSSGIETDGFKDKAKMEEFLKAVRNI